MFKLKILITGDDWQHANSPTCRVVRVYVKPNSKTIYVKNTCDEDNHLPLRVMKLLNCADKYIAFLAPPKFLKKRVLMVSTLDVCEHNLEFGCCFHEDFLSELKQMNERYISDSLRNTSL
jgi:hypothetical protein